MKNIKYVTSLLLAILLAFSCTSAFAAELSTAPVDSTGHIHRAKDWDWTTMAAQGFFTPNESNQLREYQILLTLEYHGITESQRCHVVRNDENNSWELRFLGSDGEKYALELCTSTVGEWVNFYMPATLLYEFIEEHPQLCCD